MAHKIKKAAVENVRVMLASFWAGGRANALTCCRNLLSLP
jgi:hypothetical protein